MKILIYSFENFHNLKSNPAYEVGKEITNKYDSEDVELIQLPVTYKCWEILKNRIIEFKPEFVLGIGVGIGINRVKIEMIGLNYKHSKIPDKEGTIFSMEKINESQDLSYETQIDVLAFVDSLRKKGIPAEISLNAGTYVCNYVYYNCLQYFLDKDAKTLFIHIPASPKEAIESNLNVATFPTSLIANEIFNTLNKTQALSKPL